LAYAGNQQMPQTDGVSMVQVIEKGDRGWDTPVVTEGRMGDRGYAHVYRSGFRTALNTKGIRTARYKYVRYSTGEEELYDLKKDPLELESRQDDPAYAGIKRALKALWWEYYDCKEAACDKPLPQRFRATVAQVKRITDAEFARTRAYYSDYPLKAAPR
jgi:N-acetylglucosamine-6-sulfatase